VGIAVAAELRDVRVAKEGADLVRLEGWVGKSGCERGHVDVGLAHFVPSLVSDVRRLQEHTEGQLVLHPQAVLHGPGNHKVGIYGAETEDGGDTCAPGGWIRQVGVRELNGLQERNHAWLPEDDIAFRFVIEDAEAAAKHGFVITKWRKGEAEPRCEQVLRLVETALRDRGHRSHKGTVTIGHPA